MSATADFINTVLGICAVPIAGCACAVLVKVRAKLGVQTTAQDKANMEAEIQAAIGAGMALVPQVMADGVMTAKGREDILRGATVYFRQRFPDRTTQIASAADQGSRKSDVDAAVQQTIAARLTNVMPGATLLPAVGGGLQTGATSAAATLPDPLAIAGLPR